MLFSGFAFAQTSVPISVFCYTFSVYNSGFDNPPASTASAACDAAISRYGQEFAGTTHVIEKRGFTESSCSGAIDGSPFASWSTAKTQGACPASQGQSDYCASSAKPITVSSPASAAADTCLNQSDPAAPAGTACAYAAGGSSVTTKGPDGSSRTTRTLVPTSAACNSGVTVASIPTTASATSSCVGYVGTVNGVQTCVPYSANAPSSASSSTSSTTTQVIDGSTTSSVSNGTRTTSCDGASCTTTTSSNGPGASGTAPAATVTTVQTKDDFCVANAKSPLCVQGSFGGGCGAFVGTGDALAVATAKAVSDSKCVLDSLKVADGYGQPALDAAGKVPIDSPVSNKLLKNVSQWADITNPFGSACVADYPLQVGGYGVVAIPFTAYCSPMQFMGALLVSFALLAGAFIIMRG